MKGSVCGYLKVSFNILLGRIEESYTILDLDSSFLLVKI
jgi:hypothetical protein